MAADKNNPIGSSHFGRGLKKTEFTPPPQAPTVEKQDFYGKLSDLRYDINWKSKDAKEALLELIDMLLEKELEE